MDTSAKFKTNWTEIVGGVVRTSILTHYQTTNFRLVQIESLQTTILNLMKIPESSLNGWKTLWVKEKLLVTSNFSFSHIVFKRRFPGASKGVIVWEWVKCESRAITHEFFIECSRKLHLAHLQLLMNTYAKFEVNRTETAG